VGGGYKSVHHLNKDRNHDKKTRWRVTRGGGAITELRAHDSIDPGAIDRKEQENSMLDHDQQPEEKEDTKKTRAKNLQGFDTDRTEKHNIKRGKESRQWRPAQSTSRAVIGEGKTWKKKKKKENRLFTYDKTTGPITHLDVHEGVPR